MLSDKVLRQKEWARLQWGRTIHCKKCGIYIKDCEPYASQGEFFHPNNGCKNAGTHDYEPIRGMVNKARGLEIAMAKKHRRARNRGARLASKHRPK